MSWLLFLLQVIYHYTLGWIVYRIQMVQIDRKIKRDFAEMSRPGYWREFYRNNQ